MKINYRAFGENITREIDLDQITIEIDDKYHTTLDIFLDKLLNRIESLEDKIVKLESIQQDPVSEYPASSLINFEDLFYGKKR